MELLDLARVSKERLRGLGLQVAYLNGEMRRAA